MASEEQKKLAEFIKNVHQMLRINARKIGASQAWKEHCQEEKILSQYAEAMRQLALEHWEHNADKKVYSRIQWIAEQSLKYFFNGGREIERNKEIKRNQYQENSGTEYKNFAECKDNISTAYHILKPEGLLFIISPDSKHASANASLMRQWRICLAYLGFTRVVYEKLPHIHCMAFRKNCHVVASQQWARRAMSQKNEYFLMENIDNVHELLKIPQDDTEYLIAEVVEQPIRSDEDNSELVDMFEELPQDLELL
ncbi:S-adenosylmethionine sensor upstream of mTORC1 [Gryllus bimaculatus]|nr:S-adenosylmethionine sensor upstream of mTORC1 [Gryllus bimaculatus]